MPRGIPKGGKKKPKEGTVVAEKASETSDTIGALIADLNKKLKGDGRVDRASQTSNPFKLRRPTGILRLDLEIGGGIPAGGITEVIAKDGIGKSTLCNFIMARNQLLYGGRSAMFIAAVEPFDKEHSRNNGVKLAYSKLELDDLEVISGEPFSKEDRKQLMSEQIGEVVEIRAATAELILEVILRLVRSNKFQLGIIDSLGALVPEAMEQGSMEDRHYGGAAGILTQFCKKLWGILGMKDENGNRNTTSIVALNQYRAKIGGPPMANPMSIQGGHAMMHAKLVDIELRGKEKLKGEDGKTIVGKVIGFKILKAKVGSHDGPVGSYRYLFKDSQVDWAQDSMDSGLHSKVISRKGPYYMWGDQKFLGAEKLLVHLSDHEVREQLRKEAYDAVGLKVMVGQ